MGGDAHMQSWQIFSHFYASSQHGFTKSETFLNETPSN